MRNIFGKFIIILALVITSVSVCFPSEVECVDIDCDTTLLSSKAPVSKTEKNDNHHCVCSMVCHNMFMNFTVTDTPAPAFTALKKSFHFIPVFYAQVILSLDKPPIV